MQQSDFGRPAHAGIMGGVLQSAGGPKAGLHQLSTVCRVPRPSRLVLARRAGATHPTSFCLDRTRSWQSTGFCFHPFAKEAKGWGTPARTGSCWPRPRKTRVRGHWSGISKRSGGLTSSIGEDAKSTEYGSLTLLHSLIDSLGGEFSTETSQAYSTQQLGPRGRAFFHSHATEGTSTATDGA